MKELIRISELCTDEGKDKYMIYAMWGHGESQHWESMTQETISAFREEAKEQIKKMDDDDDDDFDRDDEDDED